MLTIDRLTWSCWRHMFQTRFLVLVCETTLSLKTLSGPSMQIVQRSSRQPRCELRTWRRTALAFNTRRVNVLVISRILWAVTRWR